MSAVVPPVVSGELPLGRRLGGFVALTKPRIIELLLVTTLPTMVVAARGVPSWTLMVATLVGGTLAAGGANAINMVVDRDIDAVMRRTRGRPLVTGVVSPAGGADRSPSRWKWWHSWSCGWLSTGSPPCWPWAATLFYVFVYTLWLKRTSRQNIVIGGAAGAVPVLVGWAAVRDTVGWAPVVLFLLMFVWTPPHFWALAIKYREDYRSAQVPMMPVVTTFKRTAGQIMGYSVLVAAVSLVFGWTAEMGPLYWVSAGVLGAVFCGLALQLWRQPTEMRAMRLFHWSITYIAALFGAMAVDQLIFH